ncbi:MAG: SCP2 sterol-binding domain-containing protein [Bacteroidota bacterium]
MSIQDTLTQITQLASTSDAIGSSVKFVMGDDTIYLDGKGAENAVSQEDKEADCTVEISLENLNSMLSGDLNPMNAFMGGKMKIQGDMGVAMKLASMFG